MSNTYQEWEDDDDDFSQSQQSESDLLKQLRKELKTKSKMLSEMEGQLSSITLLQSFQLLKKIVAFGMHSKIRM